MATGRGGVSRILLKLEKSIENGNYYEAHQMYKTLSFRYVSQHLYKDAVNILYDGSKLLLGNDHQESGLDLAMLLVSTLNNNKVEVTDELIGRLGALHEIMDKDKVERCNFIHLSILWTTSNPLQERLHRLFAISLSNKNVYGEAHHHFIHSDDDGSTFGKMLIEFHIKKGFKSEVDLFIANAVLQYLCLRKQQPAEKVFRTYTNQHPSVENGPPFIRPLLNFCWLLLLTLQTPKLAVYTLLIEKYEISINRDPAYKRYLDKIGQNYFGLQPPPTSQPENSFVDSIMRMFTSEMDPMTFSDEGIE